MSLNFKYRMILQRKVCMMVIAGFSAITLMAQVPYGAKENFHLKIEQENRFCLSAYQQTGLNGTSGTELTLSNGAMVEIAIKQVTFGATFLNEAVSNSGLSKTDLDLGYEYYLSKSLNLQPFAGCEMNENGPGFTMGAKLNKNIELFDFISLGLFVGMRYSSIESIRSIYDNYPSSVSHGYLSGSAGVYFMIYDYRRPTIRRDW